jgi:hypothetical protein
VTEGGIVRVRRRSLSVGEGGWRRYFSAKWAPRFDRIMAEAQLGMMCNRSVAQYWGDNDDNDRAAADDMVRTETPPWGFWNV